MTTRTPEAIGRAILDLKSTDEGVRIGAALTLGLRGVRAAVPALAELLRSESALDRRAAARALGKIGAPEAAPALRDSSMKDKDARVRELASEALERITRARRAA